MRPDWLDERTAEQVASIFAECGVAEDAVLVLSDTGGDEAVFLVPPEDAAAMREATLTRSLMDLLGRKVIIFTDLRLAPSWPLSRGRGGRSRGGA